MINTKQLREYRKRLITDLPEPENSFIFPSVAVIVGIALAAMLIMIRGCMTLAHADELPEVNCIIGEASGEGMAGMLAVAQALRNRGTMNGVYGCNAKHIKTESQDTKDLARWAWLTAEKYPNYLDLVENANSWGTDLDITKSHMNEKCTRTTKVGAHYFFICDLKDE